MPGAQYIVLRRDLYTVLKWPLGSVVAQVRLWDMSKVSNLLHQGFIKQETHTHKLQACHASTAALWCSRAEPLTQEYCKPENLDSMHKVHFTPPTVAPLHTKQQRQSLTQSYDTDILQVVLEVKGQAQLESLASKLHEAGIRHKLWMEQPENIPTSIATAPYTKSAVQQYFKKLKLCSS